MSKILFILPGFNFGGTVFSTLNMISFLRKNYDVAVLPMTYQGPVVKYYRDAGIELLHQSVRIAALTGRIDREPNKLKKIIYFYHKVLRRLCSKVGIDYELLLFKQEAKRIENNYRFDYVASCQEGGSTYFASCFTKHKKIAWFRSEYSVYKNQLSQKEIKKEQRLYPLFEKVVCVSQTTRDDFAVYFPNINDKVFAIHNIQFVDSIFKKAKQKIDDPFGIEVFNIISVGRFAPQKRFSSIPQIVNELKKRNINFKWYIIGDGNMGDEWDKTQNNIKKYDVADRLVCIGSRLNPYPYIASADLSVTPSYYEACPRVVIEAKILHTPVVCADFSSAHEFVTNDVDGYVDTIDMIVNPITQLISNKDLYDRIKAECDKYSIDNNILYAKLIEVFK